MNTPPPGIATERLRLRPWKADDLPAFHAIWGDPEVIWWGAHESLEATRIALTALLERHATWPPGLGWFALCARDSGAIVGDVILQPAPFVDGIEIGWHLGRSAWGRGLATEAARAVLAYGFEQVGLERIYAIVATQNERSLRVVQKLGFGPVQDMEYAGLPHRLFAIDAPPG
jgi:RimJ/RimL family protein N-acetyltransferase